MLRWNEVGVLTALAFAGQIALSAEQTDELGTAVIQLTAKSDITVTLRSTLVWALVLYLILHSEEGFELDFEALLPLNHHRMSISFGVLSSPCNVVG